MKILFIMTMVKTGQKVYSIVPELSKLANVDVDVLLHYRTEHPQADFKEAWKIMDWNSVREISLTTARNGKYDLILIDNNLEKEGIEYSIFLKMAQRGKIPFMGCPHGNRNFNSKHGVKIGQLYTHCFVLGKKEHKKLVALGQDEKRMIPAGIPSNDSLATMKKGDKHVLVITNHISRGLGNLTRDRPKMKTMGPREFLETGALDLARRYKCKVVVKTKATPERYFVKALRTYKNLHFVSGVSADANVNNKLIADSKFVISCPSTMAFSSIQLGIPTVILGGKKLRYNIPFGQIGCFYDFPGLVNNINKNEIITKLVKQKNDNIKYDDFIKDTIEGGIDFSSTKIYIKNLIRLMGLV